MKQFMVKIFVLTGLVTMVACTNDLPKRDPAFAAVRPVAAPVPDQQNGSIYNAQTSVSYFQDYKARRVGDILTVRLEEQTNAEKESETTVDKTNSTNIANPTILGAQPEFSLPGALPLDNSTGSLAFNTNSATNFEGESESEQNNTLTGDISVSVVEVLANGNMVVRGEKVVTINQGHEYLRLSGIVSPRDIDSTNTVSSKRIADAQIGYTGDGAPNDANVMGWLSRFFVGSLMPF